MSSSAHELRNSLAIVNINADLLQKNGINNPPVPASDTLPMSLNLITDIKQAVQEMAQALDMLLVKVRQHEPLKREHFQRYSAAKTIAETIARYPLRAFQKRLLKTAIVAVDFQYQGDNILTQHVLFSLIKNALQVAGAAKQGCITISIDLQKPRFNQIVMCHTAKKMTSAALASLILAAKTPATPSEYSDSDLAFCKSVMQSYGGDIVGHCTADEYTQFILNFPKI